MKKWQLIFGVMLLMLHNAYAQENEDFGLEMSESQTQVVNEPQTIDEEFAEEEIFDTPAAENINDNAQQDQAAAEPIVAAEPATATEPEDIISEPEETSSEPKENLSALVERLNLSAEQLDTLKFISDETRLRQEQLEKSIELFKAQARENEEQSLREFEAVLTTEQKEIFKQIIQQTDNEQTN